MTTLIHSNPPAEIAKTNGPVKSAQEEDLELLKEDMPISQRRKNAL